MHFCGNKPVVMVIKSSVAHVVIPDIDVASFVLKELKRWKSKKAIIETGNNCKEYTYDEVRENTMKCGSAFYRMGLRKGDVVATCLTNCAEFVFIAIGTNACGGILAPVNPICTEEEMLQRLNQVKPKFVFANSFNYEMLKTVCRKLACVEELICIEEGIEGTTFTKFIATGDIKDFSTDVEINGEDLAFILFTSGTTGPPKAVMLTQRNVLASLSVGRAGKFGLDATDVTYLFIPMYHVTSVFGSLFTLTQGAAMVLKTKFDFKEMLQEISKYKVTYVNVLPKMVSALNQLPTDSVFDLSSLRRIWVGSERLSFSVADSVIEKYKVGIGQGWGMSEGVIISLGPDARLGVGSVGKLIANTHMKVVDISSGKELGPNEDGELCLKGPQFTKGYLNNPEATAKAIDSEGWLHTEDIGHYDDNEFIYIVDRLKSLIISYGKLVSPSELEGVLLRHPLIGDVGVIGIRDYDAGHFPKAYVVKKDPSLTEKEIHEFLKDKVEDFKLLRGGITFIDAIPKTAVGKTLHRALKELEKK